jgi:hypothetical protein
MSIEKNDHDESRCVRRAARDTIEIFAMSGFFDEYVIACVIVCVSESVCVTC